MTALTTLNLATLWSGVNNAWFSPFITVISPGEACHMFFLEYVRLLMNAVNLHVSGTVLNILILPILPFPYWYFTDKALRKDGAKVC